MSHYKILSGELLFKFTGLDKSLEALLSCDVTTFVVWLIPVIGRSSSDCERKLIQDSQVLPDRAWSRLTDHPLVQKTTKPQSVKR